MYRHSQCLVQSAEIYIFIFLIKFVNLVKGIWDIYFISCERNIVLLESKTDITRTGFMVYLLLFLKFGIFLWVNKILN